MTMKIPRKTLAVSMTLLLGGCMVGPDYQKPPIELPMTFKEGTQWQRAQANPQGALDSQWWLSYQDPILNDLIARSAKANQSIIAAEAADVLCIKLYKHGGITPARKIAAIAQAANVKIN